MTSKPKRILFESIGELSKDIMATAVVSAIKREYPDIPIIVTSANPVVWLHNPDVFRIYNIADTPYYYDDYVSDGASIIFKLDPYNSNGFLLEGKHLIDVWCKLCGVKHKGTKPQLFFTAREKAVAQKFFESDRPIFLIQTTGEVGGFPYPTVWSRDFNLAQAEEIVEIMLQKGYDVIQVGNLQDKTIRGARSLVLENRLLMAALPHANKRLFVDSFPHQAATALNLPSTIIWNTLNATRHGDPMHHNIEARETAEATELRERYIDQFRVFRTLPPGTPAREPLLLHNTEDIIKSLTD